MTMTYSPKAFLDLLFSSNPPAFALLHRPGAGNRTSIECLTGRIRRLTSLDQIPQPTINHKSERYQSLILVPFRQAIERGFECRDDHTPLTVMEVDGYSITPVNDILPMLPDVPTSLRDVRFDTSDPRYANAVRRVIHDEIGGGEGSNFVVSRSVIANIIDYDLAKCLSAFKHLLMYETGAYWSFLVHIGGRILIGATPERHISLTDGTVIVNPISGTYRYPPDGPSLQGVLDFLKDPKETNELYMVVDEELKMMARICKEGGRVSGPHLKEMARLAHTEYLIEGRSDKGVHELLRESMFAPTVVGSPLENAFRVVKRNEPRSRGYYGGIIAIVGQNDAGSVMLDSSILIRTADISRKGRLRITVGASLVRDSNPDSEAKETVTKAAGLLAAFDQVGATQTLEQFRQDHHFANRFSDLTQVRNCLAERNTHLANYWFTPPTTRKTVVSEFVGKRIIVVDAEDSFTSMLTQQLRSLSLDVTLRNCAYADAWDISTRDLVVIGPGPGDPRNLGSSRISCLHALVSKLRELNVPILGICLGHQILCLNLGFEVVRLESPNQGIQKQIDLFGKAELVGFYNTYSARVKKGYLHTSGPIIPDLLEGTCRISDISYDRDTGDIFALRGHRFASLQFHAESILTQNGFDILHATIANLLVASQV